MLAMCSNVHVHNVRVRPFQTFSQRTVLYGKDAIVSDEVDTKLLFSPTYTHTVR